MRSWLYYQSDYTYYSDDVNALLVSAIVIYRLIADVASDDDDSQTFFSDERILMISAAERSTVTCTLPEGTDTQIQIPNRDYFTDQTISGGVG